MILDGYGRVAIVTGAAQGIGLAVAKMLVEDGKKVAFIDINIEELEKVRTEWFGSDHAFDGSEALFLQGDVSDINSIQSCVDQIIHKWKRIDILINNAMVRSEASIEEVTLEEWNRIISVNLTGTFFFSQLVVPIMKEQEWGRIVNVSSYAGYYGPLTSGPHYSASKAGQIALTKVFARELAETGITANAVAPAAIWSPELERIPEKTLEQIVQNVPMKRIGEPTEVAKLISFLVSDAASFVTGATYDINGGIIMR